MFNQNQHQSQGSMSKSQQNDNTVVTYYTFENIEKMNIDIDSRKQIFEAFISIIEKRSKIENAYSQKLSQLSSMTVRSLNTKSYSLLLNGFLKMIDQQAKEAKRFSIKLQQQILPKFRAYTQKNDFIIKKHQSSCVSLHKQLIRQEQSYKKIYAKYMKSCQELIKMKIECVAALSSCEIGFEKKNRLFLKVDNAESQLAIINQEYKGFCQRINEYINENYQKVSSMTSKLEAYQNQKIEIMKSALISIEQMKLTMGKNIIERSQNWINRIENLKNVEIQTFQNERINTQIEKLRKHCKNPCQYINNLLNKMKDKNKKIEEIILYGQSYQHKGIIDKHINQKQTKIVFGEEEETEINISININTDLIKIISLFRNIFEETQKDETNIISQFQNLITDKPLIRKDFIFCLQTLRLMSKFELKFTKINLISKCLNIYLTKCKQEFDTFNAKKLMMLSASYYVINNLNEEIYLLQYIKHHSIWEDIGWWECALLETLYELIKINGKKTNSPTISLWDIKGIGGKFQTSQNGQVIFSNIVFNQLTFYVQSMGLIGIDLQKITKFSKRFCNLFKLGESMQKQLSQLILGLVKQRSLSKKESENNSEQSPSRVKENKS